MKIKSYEALHRWKEIMKLLPANNQLDHNCKPEEVLLDWEGNTIHIDYFKNP